MAASRWRRRRCPGADLNGRRPADNAGLCRLSYRGKGASQPPSDGAVGAQPLRKAPESRVEAIDRPVHGVTPAGVIQSLGSIW